MKKALFISLLLLVSGSVLAGLLIFGGNPEKFKSWWQHVTRDSDTMPWSPYNSRLVDASEVHLKEATGITFVDSNLFWKGEGATAGPELSQSGKVVSIVLTSGGEGYGKDTIAQATGAGSGQFELGKVKVEAGEVQSVQLVKAGTWYNTPRFHARSKDGHIEASPYSGKSELKFDNGQVQDRKQFLSGELHGKWERFRRNGVKVFVKEFKNGEKHGTHIYWFHEPQDPEDYKTQSEAHLKKKIYASLWLEVNEDARKKFPDYPSPETNEWIMKKYEERGGTFQVRLLEHYEDNKRHGLFEGFDYLGNPTFTDDYDMGRRIKHKTHDKIKKG